MTVGQVWEGGWEPDRVRPILEARGHCLHPTPSKHKSQRRTFLAGSQAKARGCGRNEDK